jgi:hypothetical protein
MGQTYRRDTSTLNIFAINDTLKYFEFYTPGYFHGNVETGFVVKREGNEYSFQSNGSSYTPFEMLFHTDSIRIKALSSDGYIAHSLNGKSFAKFSDSTSQIVSQFHLNHPIFYKAKSNLKIKVYTYPAFESESTQIFFKKGHEIEEKWSVGLYNKYKPIKDKTWIAAVCVSKFIGWFLLSDVEASFEKIEQ